jgi:hypothetical protein
MGHSNPHAELIYQHATRERDEAIAEAIGEVFATARRKGTSKGRSDAPMFVRPSWGRAGAGAEGAVEVAGEVALDAAADLPVGLAFGAAALDVGKGGRVAAHAAHCHGVQCAVELPVAGPVETVPAGPPGGHWDGGGSREHGEGCLGADPPGVRPGQQDLRGGERTETVLSRDQPGARSPAIAAIWASSSSATPVRATARWPQADQGLVHDPCQPAGFARAGQLRACPGPALRRDVAELVAHRPRRGDQDRGQGRAGGLAGLDGVMPAARASWMVAVVPGLVLRKNATQPPAPRAII